LPRVRQSLGMVRRSILSHLTYAAW